MWKGFLDTWIAMLKGGIEQGIEEVWECRVC